MEVAGTEEQVLVLAMRAKGDVTWAPFAGVVTVMADAGTLDATKAKTAKSKVFTDMPRDGWARIGNLGCGLHPVRTCR